jgi:preprotein translocase YajC subunit
MINILLAIDGMTIGLIVLVVFMFGLMMWQSSRQRKAQADFLAMLDTLHAGMRVKMGSGVIGRIKEIREEAPGFKTVLIETGDSKNMSYLVYDIHAVQGIVNEQAIMELNMKKAAAAEEAKPEPVIDAEGEAIKLNGEEFNAEEYVEKRNKSTKAKTKK